MFDTGTLKEMVETAKDLGVLINTLCKLVEVLNPARTRAVLTCHAEARR